MLALLRYLKPYWWMALLAPVLMILEVVCDLAQPGFLARIIDIGIADRNQAYILRTGGTMLLIALVGAVGGIGCTVFSSLAGQYFATDLRVDLFRHIQTFSFEDLDRFQTSSLMTRLTNDIMQVQNLVMMMLRIMVRAPLLILGGLIMAMSIHPGIALISLSTLPVLAVALFFILRKGFPLFDQVQKKLDSVNTVMRENLSGIRVIKAFVRSDYEINRFGRSNQALTETTVTANRFVGNVTPLMMFLMNISIILLLWFGGYEVDSGSLQLGQVMALFNYIMQILMSLLMTGMLLMNASRARASAVRIRDVLQSEPGIRDGQPAAAGAAAADYAREGSGEDGQAIIRAGKIEFDHVYFGYPGASGDPVLSDINLIINPGETLAVLGATGSGKTTLVSLIPRFYDVTGGTIRIDGVDIRQMKLNELRRKIGFVLQEAVLFSGSIRENILWGNEAAPEDDIRAVARIAQAEDFIEAYPDGYETKIGQRGINLSGGQKQRLSLARTLLRNPQILILDDSTSAVDLGTEARIQELLRQRLSGTTCIVIAQRISSVLDADRIIVIEDGRITGSGDHETLLAGHSAYRSICESQLGLEGIS